MPGFFVRLGSSMLATMSSKSSSTTGSDSAVALERRVWHHIDEGEVQAAISACQELNTRFPDHASGWHSASQIALKLRNPKAALAAIEKALVLEPDSTAWAIHRAQCLARLGDMERVNDEVAKLSPRNIKSPYLLSALAVLYTQLGRREDALELYESSATGARGSATFLQHRLYATFAW